MRIVGSNIYTMLHCPRAVALDLHEDRSRRRPPSEVEEFVFQRGRDWEARCVARLDYVEPQYPKRDFEAGAQQTAALLEEGVEGVSQGVLLSGQRLGIPDLLRRAAGDSELGSYHYVVGDIKSSGRARSDQILQVAFYSRLLAELQDRAPEYGYLILKDGREERFELAGLEAAIEEVEEKVLGICEDPEQVTPFFSPACGSCHWSEICLPALEAADDLSLLQGMTRGLRQTLTRGGCQDAAALCSIAVEPTARQTHLEPALLRRLKRAAEARALGKPLAEKRSKKVTEGKAAVVYHLEDPYADRILFFGLCYPAADGGEYKTVCPAAREEELPAFLSLLKDIESHVPIYHYGNRLPYWYAEAAREQAVGQRVAGRFLDLGKRLRGAAVYPGPVFGLEDHVRFLLGKDPMREGEARAAAMWAARPEGQAWLCNKGCCDLEDLCSLVAMLREGSIGSVP